MDGIIFTNDFTGGVADLTNKIAALGYNDTPFFSSVQKAVPDKKAKTYLGHAWEYEVAPEGDVTNAHFEGSAPAAAISNVLGGSANHYQIIKDTYGVTGSAEDLERRDGKKELNQQGALALIKHRKTIEDILFSKQAPVQRVNTGVKIAGKAGSLWHWSNAQNTIDLAGAFTPKKLKEMLKIAYYKGVPVDTLWLSDVQKDIMDDWYMSIARVGMGQKTVNANNIEMITGIPYAPNLKVKVSTRLADSEVMGLNMPSIALVYQRLTKKKNLPELNDVVEREILSELTLRMNNPYAGVYMTGLDV